MKKPRTRPRGNVANASDTVTSTPNAISSPQPSGPKLTSVSSLSIGSRERVERAGGQRRGMRVLASPAVPPGVAPSVAVGVEAEVLVVDFLVLAVGAYGV